MSPLVLAVVCAGAVLVVAAVIFFALSYVCYVMAFRKKRKPTDPQDLPRTEQNAPYYEKIRAMIRDAQSLPYEEVSVQSFDGLTLFGKLYMVRPGAPIRLLFHGYRSAGERDFSGGLKQTLTDGHNALMVDQRAHGKSRGKTIVFGVNERYDCLSWIKYISDRFGNGQKIILVGVSMGAATVLMAGGLDLPDNVVGIIADCGYTSPKEIIKKVIRDMHLPAGITYFFAHCGARIFGRFDVDAAGAEEALRHCRVPVLFIHGDEDYFVPVEMTKKNYAACASKKQLLIVHGAGHALSYLVDENAYIAAERKFIADILPQ